MGAVSTKRRLAALGAIALFSVTTIVVVILLANDIGALLLALIGLGIGVIGAWWLLTEDGLLRALSPVALVGGLGLFVLSLWLATDDDASALLRAVVLGAMFGISVALGRFSLTRPHAAEAEAASRIDPPQRPVLLCNPWSGGGKVASFGLAELATELGIEVVMLEEGLDLEQLTRDAVARGADCLGMAGGDGSQALVASVAVEHDLPFVCIPAGTRNHFALDLGLDRTDPRAAVYAYKDAVERRVDYATVNDRLFVNNVSLGIYATIVQSDDYRDAKIEVTLETARQHLGRQSKPFDLQYLLPDGNEIDDAFVIMVSNNPYVLDANPDVAQRHSIDSGELGVFALSPRTGGQAARLMTLSALGLRDISKYWWDFAAQEFEVRSKSGTAYMGVDGEALEATTPLRFAIHAQGLRMLVPNGNLEMVERRRARDTRFYKVFSVALGRSPS